MRSRHLDDFLRVYVGHAAAKKMETAEEFSFFPSHACSLTCESAKNKSCEIMAFKPMILFYEIVEGNNGILLLREKLPTSITPPPPSFLYLGLIHS